MGEMMDAVPRLHPDTGIQRVGGRLLAAGPPNALHTFYDDAGEPSEVAERIVELADGRRTLREIVAVLLDEFGVEPEVCARDASGFVQTLVQRQVLVL